MKRNPKILHEPIDKIENNLQNQSENYWMKRGEKSVLELFSLMSSRVPAYKDFLAKNHINPTKIKTIEDISSIPSIDKESYLKAYPYEALCWDGKLADTAMTISATSGSTGEPFYFPRTNEQDMQYARVAELYLRNNFDLHKRRTLYINGFAMGIWIGGVFTYKAISLVAETGNYPLSIVNPGVQKDQVLKAVKKLGPYYDQIILGGYPPMVKDVIDLGSEQGIDWSKYKLGFIFSAEGFSEAFRDYILEHTGTHNQYISSLNHYGTVDLGTMAHETPLSIYLRRVTAQKEDMLFELFQNGYSQPTVAQYFPELFYFQEENNHLVCSAWSGIPLLRYDLKDIGGIYHIDQITQLLLKYDIDIRKDIKNAKIEKYCWNLPFVYVHERADFVVKLYGANIYPHTIRKAIMEEQIKSQLTGKFTMTVQYNADHQPQLHIHFELRNGIKVSQELGAYIKDTVIAYLLKENTEYRSNYNESPIRQVPIVTLWEYEDSTYFQPGGKQKWVK